MKKKYYYDCPIQALYMMKEFGVNLKCENESSSYYYSSGKAMLDHIRREVLKDTTWEKNLGKIYVAPESEHIFELKEGDLCKNIEDDDMGELCMIQGHGLAIPVANGGEGEWMVVDKSEVEILKRDNKQFFMPKEEN